MSQGFSGIKDRVEEKRLREQQRKFDQKKFEGPPPLYFSIKDGESAHVRFLEEDEGVHYADVHEIPVEGRKYGFTVPCLDQKAEGLPCPGCERGLARKFKGWINVVWFDAPVWKRDENMRLVKDDFQNKIKTGEKTQVAIWSSGIRLFEKLEVINDRYKGLRSRRFEVTRVGVDLPRYEIVPSDIDGGPQEFSPIEDELDKEKHDLKQYTVPGTEDSFLEALGEAPRGNRQENQGESKNPWTKIEV
jgi:hypothetical protein